MLIIRNITYSQRLFVFGFYDGRISRPEILRKVFLEILNSIVAGEKERLPQEQGAFNKSGHPVSTVRVACPRDVKASRRVSVQE